MAQRLQRRQRRTASEQRGGAPKTGEQAFQAQCAACHAVGALGSPKFGDKAAWAPRIGAGLAALTNSALKGRTCRRRLAAR